MRLFGGDGDMCGATDGGAMKAASYARGCRGRAQPLHRLRRLLHLCDGKICGDGQAQKAREQVCMRGDAAWEQSPKISEKCT